MLKRCFDFLLSLLLLPLFILIFPIVVGAICLDSPGSPLFIQRRIGYKLREFSLYKFRTMHHGTGDVPSHMAGPGSVTRLGRILRATKIDELPQIINVIAGQMSFVGPRPCLPSQTDIITRRLERCVFDARPGITGLSQINQIDMSDPDRLVEMDEIYCARQSIIYDIRIIIKTLSGRGFGDPALRK